MGWFAFIGEIWLQTLAWLAALAVAFGILTYWMPCNPAMRWWKNWRAVRTDLVYWLLGPLLARLARLILLVVGIALLFHGREPEPWPVRDWALWQQALAILLIQDVLLYWIHRIFHTRLAWKIHAVHHSPTVLDWMSAGRFHPLNNLLSFSLADVVVLLLGFSPVALAVMAPFQLIYSALVHANLNWTFGPLRYVFASPVFHRWHHTVQEEGLNKNFASTFAFLDLLFGTFYMPADTLPCDFGTGEHAFPEDFVGQLIYPFRTGIAATGITAVLLSAVCLLVGRMYSLPRPEDRNEQVLGDAEAQWHEHQPIAAMMEHPSAVLSVVLSADGRSFFTGHEDGTIQVWDAVTDEKRMTLTGSAHAINSLALSGDGQRIVAGSHDGTVQVWDGPNWQRKHVLTGHKRAVLSVAISADGRRIVSGSAEMTVKVWDAATGKEERTIKGLPGAVNSVAISADGRRIVCASGETVTVWDAETGGPELTLTRHRDLVYCVAMSADGSRVASGSFDQTIKIWDLETKQEECTLLGHTDNVYCLAMSGDGKHLASGSNDATVKLWDVERKREVFSFKGHTDAVTCIAISPDGKHIISGSRDGTMKVWDGKEGR